MLDNHDNRNLSDVFRELQEIQQSQTANAKKHVQRKTKARKRLSLR